MNYWVVGISYRPSLEAVEECYFSTMTEAIETVATLLTDYPGSRVEIASGEFDGAAPHLILLPEASPSILVN